MPTEFLNDLKRKRFLESFKRAGLSKSEAEVCVYAIQGFSSKEISEKLFVSVKTIKFHFTNIFKKLKIFNRSQIIWRVYPLNKLVSQDFRKLEIGQKLKNRYGLPYSILFKGKNQKTFASK